MDIPSYDPDAAIHYAFNRADDITNLADRVKSSFNEALVCLQQNLSTAAYFIIKELGYQGTVNVLRPIFFQLSVVEQVVVLAKSHSGCVKHMLNNIDDSGRLSKREEFYDAVISLANVVATFAASLEQSGKAFKALGTEVKITKMRLDKIIQKGIIDSRELEQCFQGLEEEMNLVYKSGMMDFISKMINSRDSHTFCLNMINERFQEWMGLLFPGQNVEMPHGFW